jgi:hypothetical protein
VNRDAGGRILNSSRESLTVFPTEVEICAHY